MSTTFHKIVQRAGIEHIPRPFDNMRASRSTEIYMAWGPKAESEWIGHSTKVAFQSYLMVLADEFSVAAGKMSMEEMDISPDVIERLRMSRLAR